MTAIALSDFGRSQAGALDHLRTHAQLKHEPALLVVAPGPGMRTANAADIALDPEFQDLVPPPPPDEHARMLHKFFQEDCSEPLVVWDCGGRLVLLIGYEFIVALRQARIPCRVAVKTFANPEQARLFVIVHRLSRPNLTPLEISYLQGVGYHDQKQPAGGDRRSAQARSFARKTAEALAESLCVSAATIRRGAALVAAVRTITGLAGPELMPVLFSRKANLKRQTLMDLAKLPQEKLRPLMDHLRSKGKLPRGWRPQAGAANSTTITMPVEQRAMAAAMLRRLGRDWLAHFPGVIEDVLRNEPEEKVTHDSEAVRKGVRPPVFSTGLGKGSDPFPDSLSL